MRPDGVFTAAAPCGPRGAEQQAVRLVAEMLQCQPIGLGAEALAEGSGADAQFENALAQTRSAACGLRSKLVCRSGTNRR